MDGRPKRTKKFAFTSVCVYNRLRVDGAFDLANSTGSCSAQSDFMETEWVNQFLIPLILRLSQNDHSKIKIVCPFNYPSIYAFQQEN